MKSFLASVSVAGALLISVIPAAAQLGGHNGALGGGAALGAMTRPLGGFSSGFNRGVGVTRGFNRTPARRGGYNYPYAYSVWVPDYFDYLNGTGAYSAPYGYGAPYGAIPPGAPAAYFDPSLAGPQPAQQPVVINQYFSGPAPAQQAYPQPPANPPEANNTNPTAGEPLGTPQNYYLIAYKNHAIYAALAYWVEDKTLHYVTTQNTHNQASIDLIDLTLTKSLNQDRQVPFSISTP